MPKNPSPDGAPSPRKQGDRWLFLLYLCDDYQLVSEESDLHGDSLERLVRKVEDIDRLAKPIEIDIVYQLDRFPLPQSDGEKSVLSDLCGPGGAVLENADDFRCIRRHLRWNSDQQEWDIIRYAPQLLTDTGDTQTLVEFFSWARQPIEEAEKIAVIFTGLGVGDKESIVGNLETDFGRVFSICDDNSSRDALSPMEVTEAIEILVSDYRGGEPIDVLGFDMSSMQFFEVSYQFMGLAHTMVASQNNTFDPFWPYDELVRATARLIAEESYVGPSDVAARFVEEIGRKLSACKAVGDDECRQSDRCDERPVVSAIELGHLDVVARSLDTFFLNLLQLLGDDAIWLMRELVFKDMRRAHQRFAKNKSGSERALIAYDLRHMLLTVEFHLEQIQDAHGVLRAWCDNELNSIYDPEKAAETFSRIGRPDDDELATDTDAEQEKKCIRDSVWEFIWERMGRRAQDGKAGAVSSLQESRLWRILKLVSFKDDVPYCPFLEDREDSAMAIPASSMIVEHRGDAFECDRKTRGSLLRLKEHFDRLTPEQLERSATSARHLLQVTKDVISLITPPPLREESSLEGFRRAPNDQDDKTKNGCIVAHYVHNARAFVEPSESGPSISDQEVTTKCDRHLADKSPVYCGISIFRPEHLGRIAESRYLDFSFHRRVHWVSLLAAINLIRKHPGQLWNVVSSLLSTCTGSGRDELLQRLAGPRSVMDQFGNQFRALQNPLTFTLTVTEDRSELSRARVSEPDSGLDTHGSGESSGLPSIQFDDLVTYILRLETNRQDAFVDTGTSSVNRRRVKQALDRLEEIIVPKESPRHGMDSLEDFARDLGEDIFQGIDFHLRREESDSIPHLQLQLPIELMGLPWEVMNEGRLTSSGQPSQMLCERFAISRQALIDSGLATSPRSRTSTRIRALIIGDPVLSDRVKKQYGSPQLPGAVDETREVEQLFHQLSSELGGTIQLDQTDIHIAETITGHKVRKLLRSGKYDIVHFAGHAVHNELTPSQSCWLMSDGELWAQEIANTLKNCKSPPWLVYANACESGMSSALPQGHRNNVYGLGTAFTNNGTTAYLGPLWPIGDFVAGQMATDFYKALLLERATIGEALYIAKRNAKQRLEGAIAGDMSWASLIAYGDSRMKLLDSIGTETTQQPSVPRKSENSELHETAINRRLKRLRKFSPTGLPIQPMQASVRSTRQAIGRQTGSRTLDDPKQRSLRIGEQELAVELLQVGGLRFWQFMDHESDDFVGLPGSPLKANLESNERFQYKLGIRGQQDIDQLARVVSHWRVPLGIGRNYQQVLEDLDSEAVGKEGLVVLDRDGRAEPLEHHRTRLVKRKINKRVNGRVLLLIHDGLGSTKKMVETLGKDFIRLMNQQYIAVLGFDHWSLHRDVAELSERLRSDLKQLVSTHKKSNDGGLKNSVDVIAMGRGGLVARALVEPLHDDADPNAEWCRFVRRIVMVGTPNFGSRFSDANDWGQAADLLANCVHLDATATYAKFSLALGQLAALSGSGDDLRSRAGGLLLSDGAPRGPMRPPLGVNYFAVAAAYAPAAAVSVSQLVKDCCDEGRFFDKPHDLLTSIDDVLGPVTSHNDGAVHRKLLKQTPYLLISPSDQSFYGNATPSVVPRRDGVHHTNLLADPECQSFIRSALVSSEIACDDSE